MAGVHAIVSVTSGDLGGRTFPTTIRRGKGQCVKLGRGLLALIQVREKALSICLRVSLSLCQSVGGGVDGLLRRRPYGAVLVLYG